MPKGKPVCLGRFQEHSCYPWWFDPELRVYSRQCSLMGCPFAETAEALFPIGRVKFTGRPARHRHAWSVWLCLATQDDLYTSEWHFKRACTDCKVAQMTEELEKR